MRKFLPIFLVAAVLSGCVAKTRYDDQEARLKDAQSKLQQYEPSSAECDRDTFMQLREQVQSLDLLSQELVDRNTELSKEVARLKVFEAASKGDAHSCDKRIEGSQAECDAKLDRARSTYEDLINELKAENKRLKAALEKTPSKKSK